MKSRAFKELFPVVILLLLHFGLRSYNLTEQNPYIDEGFHSARAAVIWDFDQHPARFSHGKLLVYFWLGIFEADAPNFLFTERLSMAIYSLISASALYIIGRMLHSHEAGLLAQGLYAFFPMAVFFERMGMADPFAAGFVALLAWRSLIFARRPKLREGFIIGILIALATLSKLTTGLTPIFPILAGILAWPWSDGPWHPLITTNRTVFIVGLISAVVLSCMAEMGIFYAELVPWTVFLFVVLGFPIPAHNWREQLDTVMRQVSDCIRFYLPGLVVAALTVIVIWLPIVIPAYLAARNNDPFTLVNPYNLERPEDLTIARYLNNINYELEDFYSRPFWATVVIGAPLLLVLEYRRARLRRSLIYLMAWMIIMSVLTVTSALLISSRYYMPLSAPITLIVAISIVSVWEARPRTNRLQGLWQIRYQALGVAGTVALIAWAIIHAIPFVTTDITEPTDLPLLRANDIEYLDGVLIGEEGARQAADHLNTIDESEPVFITWDICHMMFFYIERDFTCVPQDDIVANMREQLLDYVKPDQTAVIIISGYRNPDAILQGIRNLDYNKSAEFRRFTIRSTRSISFWTVQWRS